MSDLVYEMFTLVSMSSTIEWALESSRPDIDVSPTILLSDKLQLLSNALESLSSPR